MNSRAKGKRGELALARKIREHGLAARRGQQYSGANGDADVIGLPGIHIECKWVERLNIWDAYDQANRDAKRGEIPIVCHKKNGTKWLVSMDLDDWLEMYKEADFD
jgi:Holliday junction resolvase